MIERAARLRARACAGARWRSLGYVEPDPAAAEAVTREQNDGWSSGWSKGLPHTQLATAFRAVGPSTTFGIVRADKWLPGRAFRGRLVRGRLLVDPSVSANRMNATYSEALPTGLMALQGTFVLNINDLRIDVREANGQPQSLTFCLFPPKPPASVPAA